MQPTVLLAFISIAGGAPTFLYHPERLQGLIRGLDSYQFARRDHAAKQLIALGPPAVDAVKKARANSPSPEFTHQADRVLREIRRRFVNPGPAVAGFRATLRIDEETFAEGADIALELELANIGREVRPVIPPVWWKLSASGGRYSDPLQTLTRPCDGEILIRQVSGRRVAEDAFLIEAERRHREPSDLRGGQAVVEIIHLGEHGRNLPPGDYEVGLVVHVSPFRAASREPLVTNLLRFRIEGRTK